LSSKRRVAPRPALTLALPPSALQRSKNDWQSLANITIFVSKGAHVMATMNVSIPDPMKDWVEERVKSGHYSNASDYVRDLIRRDQEKRDALVQALVEAEQGGISPRSVQRIIAETKTKLKNVEL
jgi:antitoxin ParD1/3/4